MSCEISLQGGQELVRELQWCTLLARRTACICLYRLDLARFVHSTSFSLSDSFGLLAAQFSFALAFQKVLA